MRLPFRIPQTCSREVSGYSSRRYEGLSVNDVAEIIVVLLAPVGLMYSWHFYLTRMRRDAGWRNRVTLLSLALVSLVALLWPIMGMLMPRADWGSGLGVDHQVQWIESWHRPILRTLLVAFVLCFFGRPRLIAPIAIACVGTALFWISSTMP
jgi:hypothetical protein